jgi:D-alanyl-D-alanine carboxypeptidase
MICTDEARQRFREEACNRSAVVRTWRAIRFSMDGRAWRNAIGRPRLRERGAESPSLYRLRGSLSSLSTQFRCRAASEQRPVQNISSIRADLNWRQHLCVCLSKWGKCHPLGQRFQTNGLSIVPFLQKLLVVPASALALTTGAGLGLRALDIRPARAEALLLVDVDSGKVINEQNATYPWYPASVTKLMTTYVTLKAVRDHRIDLESVFTVSPNAVAQQPSKMGFKVGTRVTVDNALKMLLVHSANDMAVVLSEGVSGSVEKFTDEMNAAAQRLGMTQTNYVNPNGLPADEQITSARDLAILARALILEFPEYDYLKRQENGAKSASAGRSQTRPRRKDATSLASKSKLPLPLKRITRHGVHYDLSDLPPELLKELSKEARRKLDHLLIEIIGGRGGTATLDEFLSTSIENIKKSGSALA